MRGTKGSESNESKMTIVSSLMIIKDLMKGNHSVSQHEVPIGVIAVDFLSKYETKLVMSEIDFEYK